MTLEDAAAPPPSPASPREREALNKRLNAVVEAISSELELQPLLTAIARHACELLGAEDGTIGLYDARREVVRSAAVYRMPPEELGAEFPAGVGLAGAVLRSRRPVLLTRYGDVPNPSYPTMAENAVIGVPILWRGQFVGFFGIGAAPPRRFDAADVETLELFARHAAIAIENARRYAEEQRRTARFALISRVASLITGGFELDAVLQKAADAIHEVLGYPNVDILLLDPNDSATLVVRVRGGVYKQVIQGEDRIPVSQGVMGAAVREGRAQLVNDTARDPRYVRPPGVVRAGAELAVPIRVGGRVLGVLNVESDQPFDELDLASLEIVADHLAVAIGNAGLFAGAQRVAVLEERQRLARDLHDSVTQMLASINMIAQSLTGAWRKDPSEGERRTERLAQLARSALAEMRALLKELRPAQQTGHSSEILLAGIVQLRLKGLTAALRGLSTGLPPGSPAVSLELGAWEPQAPEHEEVFFRVAQEGLTNAIRHSGGRNVRIAAVVFGGEAVLTVKDDGRGFEPQSAARAAAERGGGFGLQSMRERLEALGGSFNVRSRPQGGTTIDARLPSRPGTRREESEE